MESQRPEGLGDEADDSRIVKRLEQIDEFEEELCGRAGLRHVDREFVERPASFMGRLFKTDPKFEPGMVSWHFALERTLERLKLQLAWFNAYNIWSRLGPKDMSMTFADAKCREHCGYALCLLYTAWNQVAHLLNFVLNWEIERKSVNPRLVETGVVSDPDVGNDPWLKALAERHRRLDRLLTLRHLESHDLGLGDRLFNLFIREGKTAGRMDALKKFESLRDEYHFLGDARRDVSDFLVRNEATIARRHTAEP